MTGLPLSITLVLALLAAFLVFVTGLKYAVADYFLRTRLTMSTFFIFIVATLSISFWHYAPATFPFTVPAALLGLVPGYVLGVRTEQQKLRMIGLDRYLQHFAHVHLADIKELQWWSIINFYSIMGGLILINFIGLSNVIFRGALDWAIVTSVIGAFLLGTLVPYLIYLWMVPAAARQESLSSEKF